jgi:hypothetical protein
MDQVKVYLKVLQKHHFWILCIVTMIAGVTGWFMARKSLSADFEKNKGSILGKFTALQGILSTENHPNNTWTTGIGELTKKEKEIVRSAWDTVYNEQKKHLEWPPELGEQFLEFIKSHPPGADIPQDLRGRYQDMIVSSEFPRLVALVDAQAYNAPKTSVGPTKKDATPAAPAHEYKVIWDSTNQQDVEKLLYFPKVPSSAEVRQAQEDIWIYKALLNIIKNMNEGTYFARVRRITEISIGPKAAADFQKGLSSKHIEHLKSAASSAAEPAAPAVAAAEGEALAKPIDENRYVDPDGKPLPSGAAALLQFKRMPIVMHLTIDQREINKLLVECANAPLPVEVRQLRINPGGAGNSPSSSKKSSGGQPTSGAAGAETETYEVPIELAGIIYIYNPPDVAKLGAAPADAAAVPVVGAPAAPAPAAAAPSAAAPAAGGP